MGKPCFFLRGDQKTWSRETSFSRNSGPGGLVLLNRSPQTGFGGPTSHCFAADPSYDMKMKEPNFLMYGNYSNPITRYGSASRAIYKVNSIIIATSCLLPLIPCKHVISYLLDTRACHIQRLDSFIYWLCHK